MLTDFISDHMVRTAQAAPMQAHWSQSPFERVVDSAVLTGTASGPTLVRTNFLAPKIVGKTLWHTEDVGITAMEVYRLSDNLVSYNRIFNWFHQAFPQAYHKGEFPHSDYTMWISGKKIRAFANLRQYPEGSYFVDMIRAEVSILGPMLEEVSGGAINSYIGSQHDLPSFLPHQRTRQLPELIKFRKTMEKRFMIQSPEGEFPVAPFEIEGWFEPCYDMPPESNPFDDNPYERIKLAMQGEKMLQKILDVFKLYLDNLRVEYRK